MKAASPFGRMMNVTKFESITFCKCVHVPPPPRQPLRLKITMRGEQWKEKVIDAINQMTTKEILLSPEIIAPTEKWSWEVFGQIYSKCHFTLHQPFLPGFNPLTRRLPLCVWGGEKFRRTYAACHFRLLLPVNLSGLHCRSPLTVRGVGIGTRKRERPDRRGAETAKVCKWHGILHRNRFETSRLPPPHPTLFYKEIDVYPKKKIFTEIRYIFPENFHKT